MASLITAYCFMHEMLDSLGGCVIFEYNSSVNTKLVFYLDIFPSRRFVCVEADTTILNMVGI
jgi:hypothetical protein